MLDELRYRRNLLAYPAGVKAGFDPTHPASQGIGPGRGVSFVSTTSGLVSLLSGVPFTANNASGTQTGTTIRSHIGQGSGVTVFSASCYSLPGQSTAAISGATFAGIFQTTATVNVGDTFLALGAGKPAALAWTGPSLAFYCGVGTPIVPTSVALVANTPYFFAVSGISAGAVHTVVVNLRTGQTYTGSSSTPDSLAAPSSSFIVCNSAVGGSNPSVSAFAAGMWTPVALPKSQLLEWAKDPWAFWYPRSRSPDFISYTPAPVTVSGGRYDSGWYRNPLAYPAGVRPKFDPTHPASQGIAGRHGFSAVATPGGMVNLVTGSGGSTTGGNEPRVINTGPTRHWPTSSIGNYNWPGTTIADQVGTLAGIVTLTGNPNGGIIVASDLGLSGGMQVKQTGVVPQLQFWTQGVFGGPDLGVYLTVNTPYFFAVSKGPLSIIAVATNLSTGATQSVVTADTHVPNAPSASQGVGGVSNNGSFQGSIAAAMFSPTHLSLDQLRTWAKEPWDFWYPRGKVLAPSIEVSTALGAVYLDPTQLGTNIVLSNLNLTATQMAAATANTRAIAHHAGGKYYCEFTVNVTGDMQVGLCNAVMPLTEYLGQDNTHSIGVDDGGGGWVGAGGTTTAPGLINGHTYGLAIDITNKKAWLKDITAGGLWNSDASANPVTGVNGATFTTIT